MAEKGHKGSQPEGGKKEEPRKKDEGNKEEEPADTVKLNEKRVHLTRIMKLIGGKDPILGLIEPSQKQNEQLLDGIEQVLKAGDQLLTKITNMSEKHDEIKRKQQIERKKKEEEERREQERKKEEQRKQEEKRRIEEQRRKEEERKKEEQRKRQEKIADFKKQREEALARIKEFDQAIDKHAQASPSTQEFQQILQFIEKQRSQLAKLQQRREEEAKKLQALKTLALEVCDNISLNPDLPDQAKIIDGLISDTYTLEEQTYSLAREKQGVSLREQHPNAGMPTGHRAYNSPSFYQSEVSNLKQKKMQKLSQLPTEQQQAQRGKIQEELAKLKSQQQFINEIKIFIELYQVDEDTLKRNRFDFPKYKQLLARKNLLIQEKKEASEEYAKLSDEINAMAGKLNTGGFLMPFHYPLDLLVKAKNHLVNEYFESQAKQLHESVRKQEQANKKRQDTIEQLKRQAEAKKEQLKQVKNDLEYHLEQEQKSFDEILHTYPQNYSQSQDIPKTVPNAKVANQSEIGTIFAQLNDLQKVDEATQILQGRKEKRLKLQDDYERLREALIEIPAQMDQHLSSTIVINDLPQGLEEEEELLRLQKQVEEIQHHRRQQKRQSEQSNIGRHSSFIL